jgi:hypothetical protein
MMIDDAVIFFGMAILTVVSLVVFELRKREIIKITDNELSSLIMIIVGVVVAIVVFVGICLIAWYL